MRLLNADVLAGNAVLGIEDIGDIRTQVRNITGAAV